MELEQTYFWTDTIKDWINLLEKDEFKEILIQQIQWLTSRQLIKVYAFVIMPNHFHVIWRIASMNGKEMPHASFNKWTSSNFLKQLRTSNPEKLINFVEKTSERNHRFWQRDPLAVLKDGRTKLEQKMDYIHLNPMSGKWSLAASHEDYKWSSAKFYWTGQDDFKILSLYG